MYKFIPLTNSERLAAIPEEDYELVCDLDWHLEDGYWAATNVDGEMVELGIFVRRLRGERLLSPAPWRNNLN
jgi:hypothetical protein